MKFHMDFVWKWTWPANWHKSAIDYKNNSFDWCIFYWYFIRISVHNRSCINITNASETMKVLENKICCWFTVSYLLRETGCDPGNCACPRTCNQIGFLFERNICILIENNTVYAEISSMCMNGYSYPNAKLSFHFQMK